MPDLQVRDLVPDDHDAALDVRTRSFGPLSEGGRTWWRERFEHTIAVRRALGVFADGEVVAMARIHAYRQLWGGRALPMAGIAGVVVAPQWRGRGVARTLMTATMHRAIELGDVVSVLFPAVSTPYRRLGWEMAGAATRTTLPAQALRQLGAPAVPLRRATPADTGEIVRLVQREGARTNASGPLELTSDNVHELLTDVDNFCYLAADGFVVYAWDDKDLRVERLVAESPETIRALWALVGSGASIVRNVYTYLPEHDPIHWFLDEKAKIEVEQERWMLRLLDAAAAIAARGYPAGLDVDVRLTLVDPWLASCAGSFQLRVSGGVGELVPTAEPGSDAVLLGPNGMAALYAGTPMHTVRGAGLATGGSPDDDALLDAAFASRCYLIDTF
jgi:predicted acetyltransferase